MSEAYAAIRYSCTKDLTTFFAPWNQNKFSPLSTMEAMKSDGSPWDHDVCRRNQGAAE